MSYFDLYKKRVGNYKDNLINRQQYMISERFEENPNYFTVQINGVDTDLIITNYSTSKTSFDFKQVASKTKDVLTLGDIINFKSFKWLVVVPPNESNQIYDSVIMQKCNQTLTLKTGESEEIVGYNDMGQPIIETNPTYTSWDCIADDKILSVDFENPINLPDGQIAVTISYPIDFDIVENLEFSMWGKDYKIIGVDYSRVIDSTGVLIITAERVE